MNKHTVRRLRDVLLAIVLSLAISIAWLKLGELPLHTALVVLPLIWVGLRHGGANAVVSGVVVGLITGAIAGHFGDIVSTALIDVLPYTAAGLAGFFAKYTQKTLNNRRYSSTYLNMGTARLMQQEIPFTWGTATLAGLESWALAFVILVVLARTNVEAIIPKRSRYLTRREVSRLLND